MYQDPNKGLAEPFTIHQIQKPEYERYLDAKIKDLTFNKIIEQHNSTIGEITLLLENNDGNKYYSRKFFKKPKIRPERSDNPIQSHENEAWVLEKLSEVKGLEDYVPKLEFRYTDRSSGDMFIIMELLEGRSKQESLGELYSEIQIVSDHTKRYVLEKARIMQVRDSILKIAHFNGLSRDYFCSSKEKSYAQRRELIDFLGNPKDAYRVSSLKEKERLLKHIVRLTHFDHLGGIQGHEFDSSKEGLEKYLSQISSKLNIDLLETINKYYKSRHEGLSLSKFGGTRSRIRLQQGDCRIQHIFKKFCDFEDWGMKEWFYDIATFSSSDLSKLPIEEIPLTASLYLIAESIWGDDSRKVRKKELDEFLKEYRNLDIIKKTTGPDIINLINKIGLETQDANDFTLGFVAGVIENRIITNGAKKKSSPEEMRLFYPYHKLSRDQLYETDLREINDLFNALTEGALVVPLDCCSNPRKAREMFYTLGNMLQRIELIDVPNLNNLRRETSSYSFFMTPQVPYHEKEVKTDKDN